MLVIFQTSIHICDCVNAGEHEFILIHSKTLIKIPQVTVSLYPWFGQIF